MSILFEAMMTSLEVSVIILELSWIWSCRFRRTHEHNVATVQGCARREWIPKSKAGPAHRRYSACWMFHSTGRSTRLYRLPDLAKSGNDALHTATCSVSVRIVCSSSSDESFGRLLGLSLRVIADAILAYSTQCHKNSLRTVLTSAEYFSSGQVMVSSSRT